MRILITGTAGFIGFHLANRMLADGHEVVGLDSVNNYYDVGLKYDRLKHAGIKPGEVVYNVVVKSHKHPSYRFIQLKMEDNASLHHFFAHQSAFDVVFHLAAQAGVRYSIENPSAYIDSNINGFINLLECCRHYKVQHLVYASSSSVYGLNESIPFSVHQTVDHPISLYAASKKSNELMAHTYSHLFGIPTTGLRFFTVYGPWGRPDMAMFLFTKAMVDNQPIKVFNYGFMQRDFTYIDDIVEGLVRVGAKPAKANPEWSGLHPDPSSSKAPYHIYNIGNNAPISLLTFIEAIEKKLGKKAEKIMLPLQAGDVPITYADVTELKNDFGYEPNTPVQEGVNHFVDWYLSYYK